jgi:hypothetical protein
MTNSQCRPLRHNINVRNSRCPPFVEPLDVALIKYRMAPSALSKHGLAPNFPKLIYECANNFTQRRAKST